MEKIEFFSLFCLYACCASLVGPVQSYPLSEYVRYFQRPINYDVPTFSIKGQIHDLYNKYSVADQGYSTELKSGSIPPPEKALSDSESKPESYEITDDERDPIGEIGVSRNPEISVSLLPLSVLKRAPEFIQVEQSPTSESVGSDQIEGKPDNSQPVEVIPKGLVNPAPLLAGLGAGGASLAMNQNSMPDINPNENNPSSHQKPESTPESNSTETESQKSDSFSNEAKPASGPSPSPAGASASPPGGGPWEMISKGLLIFSAASGVAQIGMLVYVSEKKLRNIMGAIEKVDDKMDKKKEKRRSRGASLPPPDIPPIDSRSFGPVVEFDRRPGHEEKPPEPNIKPEPEPPKFPEPAVEPKPAEAPEPVIEPEPPKAPEPVVEPEPSQPSEPIVESKPEQPKPAEPEPTAEPEPPKPPEPEPEPIVEPEPPKPPKPSPVVLGNYECIVVNESTVEFTGQDLPIDWINPFAFYFKFDDGDHLWVYNTENGSLYPVINSVPEDFIINPVRRFSTEPAEEVGKILGRFGGHTISNNNIEVNGQTRNLTWINSLAFYFEYSEGNHQVWVYNTQAKGYLQLLSDRGTSVQEAHALADNAFHRLEEKVENPVIGKYSRIIVKESTADHSGRTDIPIEWINPFAFYFKWDDKNHQIWVYNTEMGCLYQICNSVRSDFIRVLIIRLSPKIQISAKEEDSVLGRFGGHTISKTHINVNGQTRPIEWVNPLAFYFQYSEGNHQVWIYNTQAKGYLQLLSDRGTSVQDAHALVDNSFHRLEEK